MGKYSTAILLTLFSSALAYPRDEIQSIAKTRARQPMQPQENHKKIQNSESFIESRSYRDYDDKIIYPADTRKNKQEKCLFGLCSDVAGYPHDKIKRLINRSDFMKEYFDAAPELPSFDINNRFNAGESSLCETMVHSIYPEKANNTNMQERIIVNVDGHKQGIVFETCVDNGVCKFSSVFPSDYTSFCKQKFIHKRLAVLGENEAIGFDTFEVPSCCVCTVKKTR